MNRAWYLLLLMTIASTAATAETGIKTVVKLMEARYAVRHHGVPGLWLAKPFMIGSGVGGLKIAEFSSFRVPSQDSYVLKQQVAMSLGPEWHPFVEEWSKRDGDWSLIYTKTNDAKVSILIATSDGEDGFTVVQMDLSGKALRQWFDGPVERAKHQPAKDSRHLEAGGNSSTPGFHE